MSIQTVLDKLDSKEDDVIWLPWVVKNPEPKRRGQRSSSNRDSRYVEYELIERIPIRASALAKCIRDFDAERRAYYKIEREAREDQKGLWRQERRFGK